MEDLAAAIDTGDRPPTTGAKPISAMQGDGIQVLNPIPGQTLGSLPRTCCNTSNDEASATAGARPLTLQQERESCILHDDF